MTTAGSMHESGHPKLLLRNNLKGWGGEGGRRGIRDGGTHVHTWLFHVNVWQKLPNIVKSLASNENK